MKLELSTEEFVAVYDLISQELRTVEEDPDLRVLTFLKDRMRDEIVTVLTSTSNIEKLSAWENVINQRLNDKKKVKSVSNK